MAPADLIWFSEHAYHVPQWKNAATVAFKNMEEMEVTS